MYHMFVRVASYYSYYERQHKCDILNADQKSPEHIDLELKLCVTNENLDRFLTKRFNCCISYVEKGNNMFVRVAFYYLLPESSAWSKQF